MIGLASFSKSTPATMACLSGLLYSVMSLSNATKNQRDCFSKLMQSYTTKIWHSISLLAVAAMQESPLLLAVAVPFVLDAMFGVKVLREVFSKQESHGDDLLNER